MNELYSHPEILLEDHLQQIGQGMKDVAGSKEINFSFLASKDLQDFVYLIGIAHDFGKGTIFFQNHLKGKSSQYSEHALISSLFAKVLVDIWSGKQNLPAWLSSLAYLSIRWHHGNLSSPEQNISNNQIFSVGKQWENIRDKTYAKLQGIYERLLAEFDLEFNEFFEKLKGEIHQKDDDFLDEYEEQFLISEKNENIYYLENYLFSLLVDTDKKCAAKLETSYFEGAKKFSVSVEKYIERMRREKPEKFNPDTPVNQLRNQFFEEVAGNDNLRSENRIYTLTAPTGIGKTFAAFEAANRLKDKLGGDRRIIYCLPFTSIIDQTYDEIERILDDQLPAQVPDYQEKQTKYLLKHHYLADMTLKRTNPKHQDSEKGSYKQSNYIRDRMVTETWESGIVVTTFVQFFHTLLGYRNRTLKKFHNMAKSIIVLDEVQNIPAKYHKLVGNMLGQFVETFDAHIILMTATQPALFNQVEDVEPVRLVKNPKDYFADEHEIFDRVDLHFLHDLSNSLHLDDFPEIFEETFFKNGGDNALVVFNTKKSAVRFFEKIKNEYRGQGYEMACLTTYQTPRERRIRIKCIKRKLKRNKNSKIICVATQLVEAGVDFSFQYVFRDFGPMDSIIQVAGRCNRNGEFDEKGKFYLMRLEDDRSKLSEYVYKDSYINQSTDEVLQDFPEKIRSSQFFELGERYFQKLTRYKIESDKLLNAVSRLDYEEVSKFQLIEQQEGQVDIVVCQKETVQQLIQDKIPEKIEELANFQGGNFTPEKEKIMSELIRLKKNLSDFTITIYENDLEYYKKNKNFEIQEIYWGKGERYIPYKSVEQNRGYNEETGFVFDPSPSNTTNTVIPSL